MLFRSVGKVKPERILVICSFSSEEFSYRFPRSYREAKGELLLDNYISEEEMEAVRGAGRANGDGCMASVAGESPGRVSTGSQEVERAVVPEENPGKNPEGAGIPGHLLPYEVQVWRF